MEFKIIVSIGPTSLRGLETKKDFSVEMHHFEI